MQDKGEPNLQTAGGCCRQGGWHIDHLAGYITRCRRLCDRGQGPWFRISSHAWAWRLGADRGSETFDPSAVTLVIRRMRITHVIIRGDSTMNIVCWFGDVCLDAVALVGGEGANTGELTIAGLSVSPGFAVTSELHIQAVCTGSPESIRVT
jgi:hypothetical protein